MRQNRLNTFLCKSLRAWPQPSAFPERSSLQDNPICRHLKIDRLRIQRCGFSVATKINGAISDSGGVAFSIEAGDRVLLGTVQFRRRNRAKKIAPLMVSLRICIFSGFSHEVSKVPEVKKKFRPGQRPEGRFRTEYAVVLQDPGCLVFEISNDLLPKGICTDPNASHTPRNGAFELLSLG